MYHSVIAHAHASSPPFSSTSNTEQANGDGHVDAVFGGSNINTMLLYVRGPCSLKSRISVEERRCETVRCVLSLLWAVAVRRGAGNGTFTERNQWAVNFRARSAMTSMVAAVGLAQPCGSTAMGLVRACATFQAWCRRSGTCFVSAVTPHPPHQPRKFTTKCNARHS